MDYTSYRHYVKYIQLLFTFKRFVRCPICTDRRLIVEQYAHHLHTVHNDDRNFWYCCTFCDSYTWHRWELKGNHGAHLYDCLKRFIENYAHPYYENDSIDLVENAVDENDSIDLVENAVEENSDDEEENSDDEEENSDDEEENSDDVVEENSDDEKENSDPSKMDLLYNNEPRVLPDWSSESRNTFCMSIFNYTPEWLPVPCHADFEFSVRDGSCYMCRIIRESSILDWMMEIQIHVDEVEFFYVKVLENRFQSFVKGMESIRENIAIIPFSYKHDKKRLYNRMVIATNNETKFLLAWSTENGICKPLSDLSKKLSKPECLAKKNFSVWHEFGNKLFRL